MDTPQMAAMAEATRLTRQGRVAEATVLIRQDLTSPAAARRAPDAPCTEGTDGTARGPGRQAAGGQV